MNTVSLDSSVYRDYKAFKTTFANKEKFLVEFSYKALLKMLDEYQDSDKGILIRFEKSTDFKNLPETFFFSFLRIDLITMTLIFKKSPFQAKSNSMTKMVDIDELGHQREEEQRDLGVQ
jgi:hypothetical protein